MKNLKRFVPVLFCLIFLAGCELPIFGTTSSEGGTLTQMNPVATIPTKMEAATDTNEATSQSSSSNDQFVEYTNKNWEISLKYPKIVSGDLIYLIDNAGGDPETLENIYLLSNVKDSALTDYVVGQKHYVVLYHEKKETGGDFRIWAVQMAKYVGQGELQATNLGSCKSYSIQTIKDGIWERAIWVSTPNQYFGLMLRSVSPGNTSLNAIFDDLKIGGCEQ